MNDIPTALRPYLNKAGDGVALSEDESREAFDIIMSGGATTAQIAGFLMALRTRVETVDEITGAVKVLREKMLSIPSPKGAIDIVGTGGDGSGTYNISTGAAIVTASCGVPVAKHGNRALSSKSGTADALKAIGVNIDCQIELLKKSLSEANICFLMAPRHHSAIKHVMAARVELGVRTMINIIGPLSNPANVKRQMTGVFAREWIVPMAKTLGNLGSEMAWVVHGSDGLDEITTTGKTFVAQLKDGNVSEFEISPADAGIPEANPQDLKGGDASHNAKALMALLEGEKGPYRDIVVLNAAASLLVAGKVDNLKDGAEMAASAIDDKKSLDTLESLINITNEPVGDDLNDEVGG